MESANKTMIIIDDSILDIFILKKLILQKNPNTSIIAFENVANAIDFTKDITFVDNKTPFIIFLDLHIPPEWTWNFLETFESLSSERKQIFDIYLTSASLDTDLIKRVMEKYLVIKNFILKPFYMESLSML
jgi:response regulator of citrate/malate metabolism